MITINGVEYFMMPCGKLLPIESVTEDACCLACIVMISEFGLEIPNAC